MKRLGMLIMIVALAASAARAGDVASELARAIELAKSSPIESRAQLSRLVFSGGLNAAQEAQALKTLTAVNKKTIFSPTLYENDPLALSYTVQPGDTLAGINRKLGLNLPVPVLERINGGSALTAGKSIKLIRGPFNGQISKKGFTLDIYLTGRDGQKVLVRRAKVAIGKNDGTPVGTFRVSGKARKATWYPPASMSKKYKNPIKCGQKGYPLGKDGLFMSLRGIDEATQNVKGYGIHGTNAQWSIGKAASHGCVRVGDGDIGAIWDLMTEGASIVRIQP